MTSLSPSVSQSISQAIEVPVITSDGVGVEFSYQAERF